MIKINKNEPGTYLINGGVRTILKTKGEKGSFYFPAGEFTHIKDAIYLYVRILNKGKASIGCGKYNHWTVEGKDSFVIVPLPKEESSFYSQ